MHTQTTLCQIGELAVGYAWSLWWQLHFWWL